jgi:hypothetical protein
MGLLKAECRQIAHAGDLSPTLRLDLPRKWTTDLVANRTMGGVTPAACEVLASC